jgi:hypothetical protein
LAVPGFAAVGRTPPGFAGVVPALSVTPPGPDVTWGLVSAAIEGPAWCDVDRSAAGPDDDMEASGSDVDGSPDVDDRGAETAGSVGPVGAAETAARSPDAGEWVAGEPQAVTMTKNDATAASPRAVRCGRIVVEIRPSAIVGRDGLG